MVVIRKTITPETSDYAMEQARCDTYLLKYQDEITQNGTYFKAIEQQEFDRLYSGFYGFNLDINVQPTLEDKTVPITTNGTQTITHGSDYDGLGTVTINTTVQPRLEDKTIDINSSGTNYITASSGYDGLRTVTVNTTLPTPETIQLQDKIVPITRNGTETVTCDSGYNGLGTVTINTQVSIQKITINSTSPVIEFQKLNTGGQIQMQANIKYLTISKDDFNNNYIGMFTASTPSNLVLLNDTGYECLIGQTSSYNLDLLYNSNIILSTNVPRKSGSGTGTFKIADIKSLKLQSDYFDIQLS